MVETRQSMSLHIGQTKNANSFEEFAKLVVISEQ